ncbi:hypothetical protein LCL95_09935 [Bacillus timonensis]|nr:hypothetical protein [Bacillus timonensis]
MKKELLLFLIILCFTFFFGCSNSEYNKIMVLGKQALKEEKYDEAIGYFKDALKEKPDNDEAIQLMLDAQDKKSLAEIMKKQDKEQKEEVKDVKKAESKEVIAYSSSKIYQWSGDYYNRFNVDEKIDLDGDGIKERITITGDSYVTDKYKISIKGEKLQEIELPYLYYEDSYIDVYIVDLNGDGFFEIIHNEGYRLFGIKIFTYDGTKLKRVSKELVGKIKNIDNEKILTYEDLYTVKDNKLFNANNELVGNFDGIEDVTVAFGSPGNEKPNESTIRQEKILSRNLSVEEFRNNYNKYYEEFYEDVEAEFKKSNGKDLEKVLIENFNDHSSGNKYIYLNDYLFLYIILTEAGYISAIDLMYETSLIEEVEVNAIPRFTVQQLLTIQSIIKATNPNADIDYIFDEIVNQKYKEGKTEAVVQLDGIIYAETSDSFKGKTHFIVGIQLE